MTYRTLVEGASWYWQKLLSESEHELAKIAKKKSFTGLMPYLSEVFNERKEHYWEYDICNLDSKEAVDAAREFIEDYSDVRFRIAFCRGFKHYIEWLKNYEVKRDKILSSNRHVAPFSHLNLNKLNDGQLKEIVISIESAIKSIVGDDPMCPSIDGLGRTEMKKLEDLLLKRCILLDKMFLGSDNELNHLRQVNNHLLKLRNELHRRTTALKRSYIADPDFDDDSEIEGHWTFYYNGDESVLKLEEDDYYGSDFALMCSVLSSFYQRKDPFGSIAASVSPGTPETLDDGKSWNNPPFNGEKFDGIVIGYALHDLCHHKHFSIPDVIRLNDFWAEAILKVQSITTQNSKSIELSRS